MGPLERRRAQGGVDPVLGAGLDREAVTLKALQALELKAMRGVGGSAALYASALKILGTETAQRIDTLACEVAGYAAWADADGQPPAELAVAVDRKSTRLNSSH